MIFGWRIEQKIGIIVTYTLHLYVHSFVSVRRKNSRNHWSFVKLLQIIQPKLHRREMLWENYFCIIIEIIRNITSLVFLNMRQNEKYMVHGATLRGSITYSEHCLALLHPMRKWSCFTIMNYWLLLYMI